MVIERGQTNTLLVMARETLSPSYWLLHFNDPDRDSNAYCVCSATNATGSFLTIPFVETNSPVAVDGEVKLSPAGNWRLKIYEQSSPTNIDTSLAGRLVKTQEVYVDAGDAADAGWTEQCPPTGTTCDYDITVNVNGVFVQTLTDINPCVANTLNINITA